MQRRISVVILVGNHRRHIGPCLRTVSWADEIVIVDDGCADGTLEIARSFPKIRIFHRRLNGDWAAQMNFGMEQAAGDWVMQLDVDERVPPDLAEELQELTLRSDLDGVAVRILGDFLGCSIGHQRMSRSTVRMVRRGSGRFEDRRVHAILQVSGNVVVASHPLVHLGPFPTAESFWLKNALYAQLEAKNNVARGERLVSNSFPSVLLHCLLKPAGVLLRKYFFEGAWRMGIVGLHYALMRAIGYYMVYLATWEIVRGECNTIRDYCTARGIPYLDDDGEPKAGSPGNSAPSKAAESER